MGGNSNHTRRSALRVSDDERLTRRDLLKGAGVIGLSTIGAGALLSACGGTPAASPTATVAASTAAAASAAATLDIEAAKREGSLTIWHGDQEPVVVELLKGFTSQTGVATEEIRILPGEVMPKLQQEQAAGVSSVDVWMSADIGALEQLRKAGNLVQYASPNLKVWDPIFKSNPEGYWASYATNGLCIVYDPKVVSPSDAPKTWTDLTDPKWKGQIGLQQTAAGDSYTWWYLLKPLMPANFFDLLAAQKPRGYASTTQIVTDIFQGTLKIGGNVGAFQKVQAAKRGQDLGLVTPSVGLPTSANAVAIIKNTKRPNAAKVFADWLLSEAGQRSLADLSGNWVPRPGVAPTGLPPISTLKVLLPTDRDDFASAAHKAEYTQIWNRITGVA